MLNNEQDVLRALQGDWIIKGGIADHGSSFVVDEDLPITIQDNLVSYNSNSGVETCEIQISFFEPINRFRVLFPCIGFTLSYLYDNDIDDLFFRLINFQPKSYEEPLVPIVYNTTDLLKSKNVIVNVYNFVRRK